VVCVVWECEETQLVRGYIRCLRESGGGGRWKVKGCSPKTRRGDENPCLDGHYERIWGGQLTRRKSSERGVTGNEPWAIQRGTFLGGPK